MKNKINFLKEKVYIIGPMTGYEEYNYPEFHRVAKELKHNYKVYNPANTYKGSKGLQWHIYLRRSIWQMVQCDYVYKLKGWQFSKGALLESLLAWILKIKRIEK